MRRFLALILAVSFLAGLGIGRGLAQETTATISGDVRDQTGAP